MPVRKYKKQTCHTTKTAAKKKATSMRNAGKTASIRKSGGKWCVYSAGKMKKRRVGATSRKRRRRA